VNGPEVDIRPPLLLRLYTYAFGVFWCAAVAHELARTLPKFNSVVLFFMLVFGATLFWRLGGLVARSEGDELLVRNVYRTRRVSASQITQVRTGPAPMQPFRRTVYVVHRFRCPRT